MFCPLTALALLASMPDAAALEARIAAVPGAEVSLVFRPLKGSAGLDLRGGVLFHAASTMKLAVLIELFRRSDAGALSLDRSLLLVNQFQSIVDRSNYALSPSDDSDAELYARVGTRVPIRELAERMMTRSSNLATNALLALLGGGRIQATARALGADTMEVLRGVEDQKAYDRGLINRTSARDLAALLEAVETGRAASPASCGAMRTILLAQESNGEIPAGLPAGTRVAHKTGSIKATLHDAAIVYPAAAPPYLLVVLTHGIPDEKVAQALIADLSRMVYAAHAVVRGQ